MSFDKSKPERRTISICDRGPHAKHVRTTSNHTIVILVFILPSGKHSSAASHVVNRLSRIRFGNRALSFQIHHPAAVPLPTCSTASPIRFLLSKTLISNTPPSSSQRSLSLRCPELVEGSKGLLGQGLLDRPPMPGRDRPRRGGMGRESRQLIPLNPPLTRGTFALPPPLLKGGRGGIISATIRPFTS